MTGPLRRTHTSHILLAYFSAVPLCTVTDASCIAQRKNAPLAMQLRLAGCIGCSLVGADSFFHAVASPFHYFVTTLGNAHSQGWTAADTGCCNVVGKASCSVHPNVCPATLRVNGNVQSVQSLYTVYYWLTITGTLLSDGLREGSQDDPDAPR